VLSWTGPHRSVSRSVASRVEKPIGSLHPSWFPTVCSVERAVRLSCEKDQSAMPRFNSDALLQIATRVLSAGGVPDDDVTAVASELVDANLVGHDSHGVMRLNQYIEYIESGFIKPGQPIDVVKERDTFSMLDAHFNFGQVAASKAVTLGIEKSRQHGTATVMIQNCNHVGRLGSYSIRAARAGLGAIMAVNAAGPGAVAPYGGIERRLGTNPITAAVPWGDDVLVLDMTTSATAEGKVRVAFQKGDHVPEGQIIDAEGNPTTDPADLYADPPGSLLPLGGPLGFKGYGLSVMVDMFAGVLSGSGVCREDLPRGANGVWMYMIDIEQFVPRSEYDALMDKYVAHIKGSRRLPGVDEILLPGEIESRRQRERQANGVEIPPETWRQLNELAGRLGTSLDDIESLAL